MVFYQWAEILENGATDTFDFIVDAAKAAQKGICRLAQTYPDNFFTISPLTKALMRATCDRLDTPLPEPGVPLPTPVGVYEVYGEVDTISNTGTPGTVSLTHRECTTSPVQGIITDVVGLYNPGPVPPGQFSNNFRIQVFHQEPDGSAPITDSTSGAVNIGRFSQYVADSFRYEIRECNPAPPPTLPDPLEEPITINRYDGDNVLVESTEYSLVIPVINNEANLNIIVNLGGVEFEFSPGGVDVREPSGGGGGGGLPGGEPRNVFNENNYNRRFPSGNNDGNEVASEEEQVEAEELEEEIEEGDLYLRVAVSTLPEGGRTQIFRNSADTDFFAGYVVFNTTDSGGNLIQGRLLPIRKAINIYPIPEYATGYRAYTVNRAKIKASYFRLPEE